MLNYHKKEHLFNMAIIKSPVWSEARGSIGGTTYARNKAGLYARNRSKPVNPNTVNQSTVRARLGAIAALYSTLTSDQVAAWNQFAQGYPAVNKVGDTYTPSGKQMFQLCNLNLGSIGVAFILAPPYDMPIVPGVITVDTPLTATADAGILQTLDFNGVTSDQTTSKIIVQATPAMAPARQSYRNRMRQLGFAAQDTDQDLLASYTTYFGSPAAAVGQRINARYAAVIPASGISSGWFYCTAVIDAV